MKALLLAVASVLLLATRQVSSGSPAFMAKCISEHGATAEDAMHFVMTGEASDNAKCVFKCIMMDCGTMTADGKMLLEPMLKHVPEKLHPVFKECTDIEPSADLCDLAFRHNKCIRDKAFEWYKDQMKA